MRHYPLSRNIFVNILAVLIVFFNSLLIYVIRTSPDVRKQVGQLN